MLTKYKTKLFSNFFSLVIVQGTNFLLPLLVMPYVIRKIGADGFGVIAVAQVFMVYLSTIADYGFNLTATKAVALYSNDLDKISHIFFTVLASKLIITAFLLVVVAMAIAFIPLFKTHYILYSLGFTYVLGQSLLVSWFFQGKEKMHYITLSTLISRVIFVMLVLLFINRKEDGRYFLFFLGTGNIIAGLFTVLLAIRVFKLRFIKPSWAGIRHELTDGWQITISNLSINTYLYSGIFILRIFTNDLVVGNYSIAERIFFAVRQVLSIFSQVIYPQICLLSQQSAAAVNVFFKQFYIPFFLLMLAGCILLFVLAPWVVYLFLTTVTATPVLLLRILCVVPVIVCLNIPAYQLLVAMNQKRSYLKIFSLATLLNIVLNIFLVKRLGATGTAISIIVTEIFITAGLTREMYKKNLAGYVMPTVQ